MFGKLAKVPQTFRLTFERKKDMLVRILLQEGNDILTESLAVLTSLFPDAELSIFSYAERKICASTALNPDVVEEISTLLKGRNVSQEIISYESGQEQLLRNGVVRMTYVPLIAGGRCIGALSIEFYEKSDVVECNERQDVFNLVTVALQQYELRKESGVALYMDSATRMPGRDYLIEQLNKRVLQKQMECCVGVISLANADALNLSEGMAAVDHRLRSIGEQLKKEYGENAYRLGGRKFAVVFEGDLYTGTYALEQTVDRILESDKKIVTSNVITTLRDDAYRTIYLCESNLKDVMQNVVVVVRDVNSSSYEDEFNKVNETYIVNEAKAVPVEEPAEDVSFSYADFERVTFEELKQEHDGELPPMHEAEDAAEPAEEVETSCEDVEESDAGMQEWSEEKSENQNSAECFAEKKEETVSSGDENYSEEKLQELYNRFFQM